MLDILDDMLDEMGIIHARLDGGTDGEDRPDLIADFNREGTKTNVFLISTRAGGMGINLQSADTVILVESDWNPAADLQAVSRVQRIGQKRTVHVMRLVTHRQIDEVIIQRARDKKRTEAIAVGAGKFSSATEGVKELHQRDIAKLLNDLDAAAPAFQEQIDLDGHVEVNTNTSAVPPLPSDASCHPGASESNPGLKAAAMPSRLVSADRSKKPPEVGGRKSIESAASTVPSLATSAVPTTVSLSQTMPRVDGLQGTDASEKPGLHPVAFQALVPCERMRRYAAEWDKLLLRTNEKSLPSLDDHHVLPVATDADTIPEWLKISGPETEFVLAGLKADGPLAATRAVEEAKEEAALLAGQSKLGRGTRKARFGISFAELADSESERSFASSSDDSSSEQYRQRRARPAVDRKNKKLEEGKDDPVNLVSDESDAYVPSDDDDDEDLDDGASQASNASGPPADLPFPVGMPPHANAPGYLERRDGSGVAAGLYPEIVHPQALKLLRAQLDRPKPVSEPLPAKALTLALQRIVSSGVDAKPVHENAAPAVFAADDATPAAENTALPAKVICIEAEGTEDTLRTSSQRAWRRDEMGGDLDLTVASQPLYLANSMASPERNVRLHRDSAGRCVTDTLEMELSFRKELQNRRLRTSLPTAGSRSLPTQSAGNRRRATTDRANLVGTRNAFINEAQPLKRRRLS